MTAATTEHRKYQAQEIENRALVGSVELRQTDQGQPEVFGYALKWGAKYRFAWFTEEIQRGALDEADTSDVRILFNHNQDLVIGRTKSGTAQIGFDEVGMWYRSSIPDSPTGQNLMESLKRGDVDQSSWAFSIARDETGRSIGDKWIIEEGKEHRIITRVATVYDASPVTYPANPDTSAAKRSLDEFRNSNKEISEEVSMQDKGLAETYDKLTRTLDLKAEIYKQRKHND